MNSGLLQSRHYFLCLKAGDIIQCGFVEKIFGRIPEAVNQLKAGAVRGDGSVKLRRAEMIIVKASFCNYAN
jgi:hypothetical protein